VSGHRSWVQIILEAQAHSASIAFGQCPQENTKIQLSYELFGQLLFGVFGINFGNCIVFGQCPQKDKLLNPD
jgi:hypothetical protein